MPQSDIARPATHPARTGRTLLFAALLLLALLTLGIPATYARSGPVQDTILEVDAADGDATIAYNATDHEFLAVSTKFVGGLPAFTARRIDPDSHRPLSRPFVVQTFHIDDILVQPKGEQRLTWNATNNEYFLVWASSRNAIGLAEVEIWGQRLSNTGLPLGDAIRISSMGPNGNTSYQPRFPDVVWNPDNNEYLVVWTSDHTFGGLVAGEFEIWAQRLDAAGAPVTTVEQVSRAGEDGTTACLALSPAVAWHPGSTGTSVYFVAWQQFCDTGSGTALLTGESEIFGQTFEPDLTPIGNIERISTLGPEKNANFGASAPDVAANLSSDDAEAVFVVVYAGDDTTAGETEVFYAIYEGVNGSVLSEDNRISTMGPDGNTTFFARTPSVAYTPDDENFLVTWEGNTNVGTLGSNEREVWGRLLDATISTVPAIGSQFRISWTGVDGQSSPFSFDAVAVSDDNDFAVLWLNSTGDVYLHPVPGNRPVEAAMSNAGGQGDAIFDATEADIVHVPQCSCFTVVWQADTNVAPLGDGEFEIFARQFADDSGNQLPTAEQRISFMGGTNGNTSFGASKPAIAFASNLDRFLVVWRGDDSDGTNSDFEIYGQILNRDLQPLGNQLTLSQMGPDGNTSFTADNPAVAYNPDRNEFLVVWHGDSDTNGRIDNEFEIWGQRVDAVNLEVEGDQTLISTFNGAGNAALISLTPAVVYNNTSDEYLVVYSADKNTGGFVDEKFVIVAERRTGTLGIPAGVTTPTVVGQFGASNDAFTDAVQPSLAWNNLSNEYLVAYSVPNQNNNAVFVNRLSPTLSSLTGGSVDIGENGQFSNSVDVAWNPTAGQYLVAWNHNLPVDGKSYTSAQHVAVNGQPLGNQFIVGVSEPLNTAGLSASQPAIAASPSANHYLVVFQADTQNAFYLDNEFEIWGELVFPFTFEVFLPLLQR